MTRSTALYNAQWKKMTANSDADEWVPPEKDF
jgi:hypothetical protein